MKLTYGQILTKARNTLTSKNITPINYCKSLDKLKILTFWQIIKDKNILLLDFDYSDGKIYTETQLSEIQQTWLRLYDEYYVVLDDSKTRFKMNKSFDELQTRNKISQIKYNYNFLLSLLSCEKDFEVTKYEQETYKRLKVIDIRIKPKYFEGIQSNLDNLDRVMKSFINRYNIDHKESQSEIQKEIDNVYDVVANAESWLAPQPIFINDMVVSHWIAIQNQIKQKQKAQQKNGK
jgi:hypothetical protein